MGGYARAMALAIVACVVLAACGSSSSSSSSASSSATSSATSAASTSTPATGGAKPTGAPIKLGMINSQTTQGAMPWFGPAAQVAVNDLNANGGIDGHPVQLDFCDDQFSPQTAAVCAQKLVNSDHVQLMVGNDGITDAPVIPLLTAKHTLEWGGFASSTADLTSSDVISLYPSYVLYALIPQLVTGKHNIAVFASDNGPGLQAAEKTAASFSKTSKTKVISVPIAATDFGTPCQQAKEMNADTAVVVFSATQVASMMQTCAQLGVKLTWVIGGPSLTDPMTQAISSLHINTIIPVGYSQKAQDDFAAAVAKYGPKVPDSLNDEAVGVYVAFKLLPAALQASGALSSSGAIDSSKLKAWAATQSSFDMQGYANNINLTPANQPLGSSYSAIKNACVYKAAVQGGKIAIQSPTPICLTK